MEKRMKRVLMIGPKSFPPDIGGIETHVYEISKRIVRMGWDVSVAVPRFTGSLKREDIVGVKVIRLPAIKNRYTLKLSLIPSLIREISAGDYAVVHAHDPTGGFASSIAAKDGRFIYTMHGLPAHPKDWPTPFRQGIGLMQEKTIRSAARIFCTDQGAVEAVTRIRPQIEVLSNGVDAETFSKERWSVPPEYTGESFRFLFIGRLAKVKGVDILLDAITRIPSETRKVMTFKFIGDGPLVDAILAKSSKIREIHYLGPISHAAVPPFYVHADAFVLPSLSEGMPLSLLEAMASNLPCIATKVGGIPSQIPHDAILGIPPSDATALAEAMMMVYQDRKVSRAMADKGRQFVIDTFSWDRICERIVATYDDVVTSSVT